MKGLGRKANRSRDAALESIVLSLLLEVSANCKECEIGYRRKNRLD